MTRLRRLFPPLIASAALWIAALACNLTGENNPATLVPRTTATPPPTIGYATLAPGELPQQATALPQARTGAALLNALNQVQGDRLFEHVSALQSMFTRHVNSPQNDPNRGIGAAVTYITRQFEAIRDASGGRFTVLPPHEFAVEFAGQNSIQRNLVGVIGGTETGAGILLLGAHYDSMSPASQDGSAFAPGANDNGSGVASLLEVARVMSQFPQRSTVMFVAFGAEEIQRAGSIAFVREYLQPNNITIDYMINMDIMGTSMGPNGEIVDNRVRVFSAGADEWAPSRRFARSLNLIAARHMTGMTVEVIAAPDRAGRYSDHLSFSDVGVPAVRFIEGVENVARQDNDRDLIDAMRVSYHTRSTQTVLATALALAGGPRPPQNISLRDEGGGQRTLVWETPPGATSYIVALRRPGSLVYDNYFEVTDNFVTWDGFRADRFVGVAIAAQDTSGLMGPLSFEYAIQN